MPCIRPCSSSSSPFSSSSLPKFSSSILTHETCSSFSPSILFLSHETSSSSSPSILFFAHESSSSASPSIFFLNHKSSSSSSLQTGRGCVFRPYLPALSNLSGGGSLESERGEEERQGRFRHCRPHRLRESVPRSPTILSSRKLSQVVIYENRWSVHLSQVIFERQKSVFEGEKS